MFYKKNQNNIEIIKVRCLINMVLFFIWVECFFVVIWWCMSSGLGNIMPKASFFRFLREKKKEINRKLFVQELNNVYADKLSN